MSPREVATRETLRFLENILPLASRVLEVGCGRGELTAALGERGFRVRALDTDAEAVESAQARGADAIRADFLTYEGGPFQVILFTRSLHHIQPLETALDRARELLETGGLLIAEEFAREVVHRETARWFYQTASRLDAQRLLTSTDDLSSQSPDPLNRWREDHMREPLNTGEQMLSAIAARFDFERSEKSPYLYRHFCGRLPETEEGLRVARRLLRTEKRRIEQGRIVAAGLRLVAARR